MTTPPRPGEHLSAPWAAVPRRFRDHPHTTSEDTDGRTP